MNIIMFIIGTVIFIAYMFGLLTMINVTHSDQKRELDKTSIADEVDMDGMGDYSRFANNLTDPNMGKRRKKQYIDSATLAFYAMAGVCLMTMVMAVVL